MASKSAGILMYKITADGPAVLLVHPGGPFWAKKDDGAWSIPKGEYEPTERALDAAKREFFEETGVRVESECIALTPVRLKSGKLVAAWACQGDLDVEQIRGNMFEMEWPPRSGNRRSFPEIDRGEWFTIELARLKINEAQAAFLDQLVVLSAVDE